ncbi:MAG: thioesterase family protein [Tumebacillaceae bacterium]
MFTHDIVVRFSECDPLGHVNNANYFTYLEEARTEVFRLFNPDLRVRQWNLIVASTRCDFLHEVVYSDRITVCTWIGRLGTSSFEVEHAIRDEEGNWVARGKATLLGYDFAEKRAIPLTEEIRAKLLQHSDAPEGVPALRA